MISFFVGQFCKASVIGKPGIPHAVPASAANTISTTSSSRPRDLFSRVVCDIFLVYKTMKQRTSRLCPFLVGVGFVVGNCSTILPK